MDNDKEIVLHNLCWQSIITQPKLKHYKINDDYITHKTTLLYKSIYLNIIYIKTKSHYALPIPISSCKQVDIEITPYSMILLPSSYTAMSDELEARESDLDSFLIKT
jgi:hypothetical protein